MEEIEAKFLDIDLEDIQKKLIKYGARKVSDLILKQKVFDYPDLRLDKIAAWVRLRDSGGKIELAFKKRLGVKDGVQNDAGMEEIEVEVSSFEKTAEIFEKMGMYLKFYEEKRRIEYKKGKIKFDIDIWPMLPPYIEIECQKWEEVVKAAADLGLKPEDKKILSSSQIFKHYGLREMDFEVITFEKQVKRVTQ